MADTGKMAEPAKELPIGCFVTIQGCTLGIGKLIEIKNNRAKVEWFRSIYDHMKNKEVQEYNIALVKRIFPSAQTRCYVTDEYESSWEMGRITQHWRTKDGTGIEYDIDFRRRTAAYIPEHLVYVRCQASSVDPIETLIYREQETPFFHRQRSLFLDSIIQQRAAAHGLTGLISSRIRLYPHQIEVARRVLEDPLQRYLLADEVGLGKTIEAGIILRQTYLDNRDAHALVIVPEAIEQQWAFELEDKFGLGVESASGNGYITLCTTDMARIKKISIKEKYDIVVIDEAHHVARAARSPDNILLWEKCCHFAHSAPRLLLLSATPALHNEQDFLAMLHLLEPTYYRLSDIEAFRKRVTDRQPIGELLLVFTEGTPIAPLRRCLSTLRALFCTDSWVLQKVNELENHCDAEEYDQEEVDSLIRTLRIYICETHRIYRRMLRSSRSSLPKGILGTRANDPKHPPWRKEWGYDESRLSRLANLLEEWRETAAGVVSLAEGHDQDVLRECLTSVLIVFIESFSTCVEVLIWAIEARLAGKKELARYEQYLGKANTYILTGLPLFRNEEDVLHAMLAAVLDRSGEDDKFDMLVTVLKLQPNKQAKSVIFTSNTMVGHKIAERLAKVMRREQLVSHLIDDSQGSRREGLQRFYSDDGPMILVCDKSGEEGLNLEFADLLVHFDLPWDPNRLEQRIGRFDRIGRTREIESRIFIASTESEDSDCSLQESWYLLLERGFNIFTESIADLQFFTEKVMPILKEKALLEGAHGLTAQLQWVQEGIRKERKLLRVQTSLDEIEALDQEYVDFRGKLSEYDDKEEGIRLAFEAWVYEALRLDRKFRSTGDRDDYGKFQARKLVRYQPSDHSLIPTEWARQIPFLNSKYACFSRQEACRIPNVSLLRIGHPLIDFMTKYLLWDDRGQAFAMWRCVPDFQLDSDLVFFELDYVLEADLEPVIALLKDRGWPENSRRPLSRRADAWLPPERRVLYIDSSIEIVSNRDLLEILLRPYRKAEAGGKDYSINTERQSALDEIIAPDRWPELCRTIREFSEATIRSDNNFQNFCEKCAQQAQSHLEIRMQQLRCGIDYRYRQSLEKTSMSRRDISTIVEEEHRLYQALIVGIQRPSVRLDAVGLFVISNRNPFAKA